MTTATAAALIDEIMTLVADELDARSSYGWTPRPIRGGVEYIDWSGARVVALYAVPTGLRLTTAERISLTAPRERAVFGDLPAGVIAPVVASLLS